MRKTGLSPCLLQPVALRGTDAGQQLVDAERLGHVIVGAEIERLHLRSPRRSRLDSTMIGTAEPPSRMRRITSSPSMSGRPRSSTTRSALAAAPRPAPPRPSSASRPRSPGCQARAQEAQDRRLVIDHQHAQRAGVMPSPHGSAGRLRRAAGSVMVNTAPRPVGAVGGGDRAAHRLDEAAADRQAEPGAGAAAVGAARRGRTCRTRAPDRAAGMPAPSSITCTRPTLRRRHAAEPDRASRRARISRRCRAG